MKTFDFNPTLTSAKLNEQFEKNFGGRVNLGKFSREQLEDMRNKVRTMVFQQESSAGYNDLLTNETYQKNQAMLQLLNTRIKEMLGEDIKKLRDKMDQLSEAKAKPDFLDMDKDGDKKEPMKKAVADKKGSRPQKGVNPFAKKDEKVKEGRAHAKGCKCEECAMTEEPNEGNAFGKAVRDAKANGVQKGEKINVGGKEYPVKEAASTDAKKQLPSMAHVKKMCQDGKSVAEICKMHPNCDRTELKQMIADCKKALDKSKSVKEAFPTVADAQARADREKTTGKFDKKDTSTGTQYTRKSNTFTDGGDDKDVKTAKKKAKSVSEAAASFKHNVRFVNESLQFLLNENEEGKAKAITAASDIVNDFTSWMQRVGQYQTKSMIELADSIKANFGAAEAEQFKTSVAASLSQTLEILTSQREAISGAVAVLAGEATPEAPMGQEPDMGMDSEMPPADGIDMSEPDDMNPEPAGDEFAGAEGPSSNREVRESREQGRARRLAEQHSIMSKLAR